MSKAARFISFADGVVRPAINERAWVDPLVQLRERVLSYGVGANLLDEDYRVVATMTYSQAYAIHRANSHNETRNKT